MIRESYLANLKNLPKDAVKIAVTRTARSPLSPSWDLLRRYKSGKISWPEFEASFRRELEERPEAQRMLDEIRRLGQHQDVYLICYEKKPPCHRFILLDILEKT